MSLAYPKILVIRAKTAAHAGLAPAHVGGKGCRGGGGGEVLSGIVAVSIVIMLTLISSSDR